MLQKCFKTLLHFLLASAVLQAHAQGHKDTTFSFYFDTNKHTADAAQQKAFETFLTTVQTIQSISGFADTTGTHAHNKTLAYRRATHIYNNLPQHLQTKIAVAAVGETNASEMMWQNRRVDVKAIRMSSSQATTSITSIDTVQELNAEHILFVPDQAELTEASFQYVQQLAQQLQQFPTENFQIIGHVNYQSNLPAERLRDMYELSEKRAKKIYDLLVLQGIVANRLSYKGVGNSQPVFPEPVNEEQKRKNMRVQVLVVKD